MVQELESAGRNGRTFEATGVIHARRKANVYTDPGPIPFGLGWIVDIVSKDSVSDILLRTKKRAESLE